ncbi:phosphotransferase [Rhodococcus hoagii]|nr:phosphotransferase [Prescottella equi]
MERVDGTILRSLPRRTSASLPRTPASCACEWSISSSSCTAWIGGVGTRRIRRGAGYVGRQVAGWTKRYAAARTDNVPDFARVTGWLADNQPADVASSMIHGDFRLDNVVSVTTCGHAPCWTGNSPPSATRSWISGRAWPTGCRPTTPDDAGHKRQRRICGHAHSPRDRRILRRANGSADRQLALLRGVRTVPAAVIAQQIYYASITGRPQPGVRALLDRRRVPRHRATN